MKRFVLGVFVGLVLGAAGSALATAVSDEDGYLYEWNVMKNGELICQAPFASHQTQELRCD